MATTGSVDGDTVDSYLVPLYSVAPSSSSSRIMYFMKVLPQLDSFSCGYHSLKNAVYIVRWFLSKDVAHLSQCNNKDTYWGLFKEWVGLLVEHSEKDKEALANDWLNADLWEKNVILEGILEKPYCHYLCEAAPQLKSLPIYILLELVYMGTGICTKKKIQQYNSMLDNVKNSEGGVNVFIVSGTPQHWITVVFIKADGKKRLILADSSQSRGWIHPIALKFINECLVEESTFSNFIFEILLENFVDEVFVELVKCKEVSGSPLPSPKDYAEVFKKANDIAKVNWKSIIKQLKYHSNDTYFKVTAKHRVNLLKCLEGITDICVYGENEEVKRDWDQQLQENQGSLNLLVYPDSIVVLWEESYKKQLSMKSHPVGINFANEIFLAKCQLYKSKESGLVSLKNHELSSFPSLLLQCNYIKSLIFSQNKLNKLIENTAKSAEGDDYSSKEIESIQNSSFIKNIQSLDLTYNNLTSFPQFLLKAEQLRSLNLSSNNLSSIPDDILLLKQLTHLSLSSNKITTIPSTLKNLQNLLYFNIQRNQLVEFPSDILECWSQLRCLEIDRNKIEVFHNFQILGNLRELEVVCCWGNLFFEGICLDFLKHVSFVDIRDLY